jgi:DNA-binding MarR family transcriptional regulator
MTTSDKLLAAFTPSIMSHETLEAIFVRREALTSHIMKDIETSATTRSKRHVLLVGPRGIGKTHLVSLIYHRVKANPDLTCRLRIAWMREEMWEVASFLDLLECIISALAAEYSNDGLAAGVSDLKMLAIEDAERRAERLLLDYLKDRVLLLIIENLDEVFDALGEIGERQLRAFLQNHTNTIVVGTTPGLFYGVSDHDSPFYGFFNVTHLDELTIDDATLLLHKIADIREDPDLAEFIASDSGHDRLAAVQHLAGGHPRIWIFFAGIVTHETLDELVPAFLEMLDDLTPYYQSRMKELPPQQRKVISHLCGRRGSAVVKDIAEACRLTPQAAAAQLHDLREKGFVRSEATGRESWYELREPLLRLVLEVKESRGRPIRLIVDFLRNWYSRPERLDKYASLPAEAYVTRRYVEAALDLGSFADSEPRRHTCIREGDDVAVYGISALLLLALDRWAEFLATLDRGISSPYPDSILGETAAYCRLMLTGNAPCSWLQRSAELVTKYANHGALTWLGLSLVQGSSLLFDPEISETSADLWNAAWSAAGSRHDDMEVPLRLLDAAVRWKRNPDRRILLALPEEERRILQEILPKQEDDHKVPDNLSRSRRRRR